MNVTALPEDKTVKTYSPCSGTRTVNRLRELEKDLARFNERRGLNVELGQVPFGVTGLTYRQADDLVYGITSHGGTAEVVSPEGAVVPFSWIKEHYL